MEKVIFTMDASGRTYPLEDRDYDLASREKQTAGINKGMFTNGVIESTPNTSMVVSAAGGTLTVGDGFAKVETITIERVVTGFQAVVSAIANYYVKLQIVEQDIALETFYVRNAGQGFQRTLKHNIIQELTNSLRTPGTVVNTNQIVVGEIILGRVNAAGTGTDLNERQTATAKFPVGSGVADGSITTLKLANGSVTEPKHATSGVSTRALADRAVTAVKVSKDAPSIADAAREPLRYISNEPLWAAGTTYGLGALVRFQGFEFISLQASNTGNSPSVSAATLYWSKSKYKLNAAGNGWDKVSNTDANYALLVEVPAFLIPPILLSPPPAFWKGIDGVVHLTGFISVANAPGPSATLFVLPSGYKNLFVTYYNSVPASQTSNTSNKYDSELTVQGGIVSVIASFPNDTSFALYFDMANFIATS